MVKADSQFLRVVDVVLDKLSIVAEDLFALLFLQKILYVHKICINRLTIGLLIGVFDSAEDTDDLH